MPPEVNDDDLSRLSVEERAALAGDDDELSNLEDVIAEADDGAGDDAAAADAAKDAGDDAATDDKADDASDDVSASAVDASDEDDDKPFAPNYVPPAVEGIDEKLAALETQRSTVLQQFRDGDLSVDEMDEQLRALGTERDALLTDKAKAAVMTDMAKQSAEQLWRHEVDRFLRNAKKAGIDYRADTDLGKKLNSSLDTTVKLLAQDPENAERDYESILQEAHAITLARFRLTEKGAAADPGKGKAADPLAAAAAARRPDLKSVPKTLAHVPAAGSDDATTGDSEFAYLDRLNGMELEVEVAKMTPAKQERWARAS